MVPIKTQLPTPVMDGVNFFQSELSFLDKFFNSSSKESIMSVDSSTELDVSSKGF